MVSLINYYDKIGCTQHTGAVSCLMWLLTTLFIVTTEKVSAENVITNSVITNDAWVGMGQAQGVNGFVYDLVSDKLGNLYAGGDFGTAGGIVATNVAKWNGNEWCSLGGGVSGPVYSMAVDKNGYLYVAGIFDKAGGIPARNIARWDGSRWSPLGIGLSIDTMQLGDINSISIVVYGETLFAGGAFDSAGVVDAYRIAAWNGSVWHALAYRGTISGIGSVHSLAVDGNGVLFVGGEFDAVSGVASKNVIQWDAGKWHPLGTGVGGNGSWVTSLIVDKEGNLYTSGNFNSVGNHSASGAAKWNGLDWVTTVPKIMAFDKAGFGYSAVSRFSDTSASKIKIFRWNGTENSEIIQLEGVYQFDRIFCMEATDDGKLFIGGSFLLSGPCPAHNVAVWDGKALALVGNDNGRGLAGGINRLVVNTAGGVYAGDQTISAGTQPLGQIAMWKDDSWQALAPCNNRINAFTVDVNDVLLAAFNNSARFMYEEESHVVGWDGGAWVAASEPLPEYGISTLIVDRTYGLVVGGQFQVQSFDTLTGLAAWKNGAWQAFGHGIMGQIFTCITDTTGNLNAAGIFDSAGGVPAMNIARWNGVSWSPLGQGLGRIGQLVSGTDEVRALAFDRAGNLFAGGKFLVAGEAAAANIAKWDGDRWSPLGRGLMLWGIQQQMTMSSGLSHSIAAGICLLAELSISRAIRRQTISHDGMEVAGILLEAVSRVGTVRR